MSDNFFLAAAASPPDDAAIAAALGEGYDRFRLVLDAASGFDLTWKYYGGKYGWKLKAHDAFKALFELTVEAPGFRVSIAARESEMRALGEDPEMAALLASGPPSAKSKEGWGIRVRVTDEASCSRAVALIKAVAEIRTESGP